MWQTDCETFRRALLPFELRDVTEPEHRDFVRTFAARHGLECEITDTTARFA